MKPSIPVYNPAFKIIARFGVGTPYSGAARVARLLGLAPSVVARWYAGRPEKRTTPGEIPVRYARELYEIAATLGIELDPAEFLERPSLVDDVEEYFQPARRQRHGSTERIQEQGQDSTVATG